MSTLCSRCALSCAQVAAPQFAPEFALPSLQPSFCHRLQEHFLEPVEQGLSAVAAHATARELRGVSSVFFASDNAFSGIVSALDDESARMAEADR